MHNGNPCCNRFFLEIYAKIIRIRVMIGSNQLVSFDTVCVALVFVQPLSCSSSSSIVQLSTSVC